MKHALVMIELYIIKFKKTSKNEKKFIFFSKTSTCMDKTRENTKGMKMKRR